MVEVAPGARFEEMTKNLYGLAQDGKTDTKGMPNLLQAALFAREFEDVLRFTKVPIIVQKVLFVVLARSPSCVLRGRRRMPRARVRGKWDAASGDRA